MQTKHYIEIHEVENGFVIRQNGRWPSQQYVAATADDVIATVTKIIK